MVNRTDFFKLCIWSGTNTIEGCKTFLKLNNIEIEQNIGFMNGYLFHLVHNKKKNKLIEKMDRKNRKKKKKTERKWKEKEKTERKRKEQEKMERKRKNG